jgi:hypothetical protein
MALRRRKATQSYGSITTRTIFGHSRAGYGCFEPEARGSYNRRYIHAPTRFGGAQLQLQPLTAGSAVHVTLDALSEAGLAQPHDTRRDRAERKVGNGVLRNIAQGARAEHRAAVQCVSLGSTLPQRQHLGGGERTHRSGSGRRQGEDRLERFDHVNVSFPALILQFDVLDRYRVGVGIEIG